MLFPPVCVFCLRPALSETGPCKACLSEIPYITEPICEVCGFEKHGCACKEKVLGYDRALGVYHYEGYAKEALLRFKRNAYKSTVEQFSEQLAQTINFRYKGVKFDAVCCVPMTEKDLYRRGYNQSELLARKAAEKIGAKFKNLLCKTRETKQQKLCDNIGRFANVLGSFDLRKGERAYGNILLIDDIRTSGATLSECSKTLKLAGAEKVYCACLALAGNDEN